jgi:hypothetical protein
MNDRDGDDEKGHGSGASDSGMKDECREEGGGASQGNFQERVKSAVEEKIGKLLRQGRGDGLFSLIERELMTASRLANCSTDQLIDMLEVMHREWKQDLDLILELRKTEPSGQETCHTCAGSSIGLRVHFLRNEANACGGRCVGPAQD